MQRIYVTYCSGVTPKDQRVYFSRRNSPGSGGGSLPLHHTPKKVRHDEPWPWPKLWLSGYLLLRPWIKNVLVNCLYSSENTTSPLPLEQVSGHSTSSVSLKRRSVSLHCFQRSRTFFLIKNDFCLIKKSNFYSKITINDKSSWFFSFFFLISTGLRAVLPASWRNGWCLLTFLQTINCGNCCGTAITSEFDGGDKSNRQSWFIPLFTTVRWLFDFTQLNLTLMMMHHKHWRR